jgi:G3E family GTPase
MDYSDDDEVPTLVDIDNTTQIPVTILIGFLGSGKTTLLNYLLTANHGYRLAIIENEFSEGLGIEGIIAKNGVTGNSLEDGFFELNNGCICCTVKDDLLVTLEQLVLHKSRFDYVIIETTGVANPGPIITTFWTDDALCSTLRLDGVVCVVDSTNIHTYLNTEDIANDVKMQISFADRILMNKVDLIQNEEEKRKEKEKGNQANTSMTKLVDVTNIVRQINSSAEMFYTSYSNIDPASVLNIDCYSTASLFGQGGQATSAAFEAKTGMINGQFCVPIDSSSNNSTPSTFDFVQSSPHMASVLMTQSLEFPSVFSLGKIKILLDDLLYANGQNYDTEDTMKDDSKTDVVPSGHASTSSDDTVIYRMKGILHIQDEKELYVLQAVHDTFDVKPSSFLIGSPDDTTGGINKIIIIGKNIDGTQLAAKFGECLL